MLISGVFYTLKSAYNPNKDACSDVVPLWFYSRDQDMNTFDDKAIIAINRKDIIQAYASEKLMNGTSVYLLLLGFYACDVLRIPDEGYKKRVPIYLEMIEEDKPVNESFRTLDRKRQLLLLYGIRWFSKELCNNETVLRAVEVSLQKFKSGYLPMTYEEEKKLAQQVSSFIDDFILIDNDKLQQSANSEVIIENEQVPNYTKGCFFLLIIGVIIFIIIAMCDG